MQETLNSKKHGDTAFRAKEFSTAIECYTVVSALPEEMTSLLCSYNDNCSCMFMILFIMELPARCGELLQNVIPHIYLIFVQ